MTEHVKKNAIIAAFDEREYQEPKEGDTMLFDFRNYPLEYYSNDWNLLMPVAKKLLKGYPFGNKFFDKQLEHYSNILEALQDCDIDALFNTCYNFIKLINQINNG